MRPGSSVIASANSILNSGGADDVMMREDAASGPNQMRNKALDPKKRPI